MAKPTMEELRGSVRGQVIARGDAEYDAARKVYNGMIDRHPAFIVRPVDAADVMAAVAYSGQNGRILSVRGGAHSVPGFGTNDGGVVIDLSRMKGIRVDPSARTVRAEGGCTWGDVFHATYPFGMTAAGGIISTTGIGGLTLGGGIGYLSRAHGLSIDNLVSADVVTADGRFLTASETQNPDLFWALRGGGGNFGVVTSFEYRLHTVKDVFVGLFFFELKAARQVLEFYRDYIATAPEEMGAFFAWQIAPPLPFIPENRQGEPFCLIVACWTGPLEKGEAAMAPIRKAGPIAAATTHPMPFPALNSAFDVLLPAGLQHYWKTAFAPEITDGAIRAHLAHGPKVPVVNSTVHIYPINGAVNRVRADATAFAYRDARFATVIAGMWPDPKDNEKNIRWVKNYYADIAPHSSPGGYVNFMAEDDQGRVKESYKGNYDRLASIKRKYDPENLFHLNQNIRPA
ncbi:MAG TPA: FAD-binding oxidoreductase [Thermoanaerobaculia bacterium]|nr:FAD-binding oxidoreductase [Thermoanaerobaculia bacterium]HQR68189.1 FAD-binding oxidoreductase [Thermoanaerobaculia bacterium]